MDRRSFLVRSAQFLLGTILAAHRPAVAGCFCLRPDTSPRVALIIDDIGFNLRRTELFLQAGIPITFSILPRLCRSEASAQAVHDSGHEIMLHQPMEPFSSTVNPGPGAIFVDDRPDRIHRVVIENILNLPNVIGVNNHMGSRYTQMPGKMDQALDAIKSRDLFFLDSLTTDHSTAYSRARQMGVAAMRRDLFLDHRRNASSVVHQLTRLTRRAQCRGTAVGIGHPHRETAQGVRRFLDTPLSRHIRFVHISELL